MESQSQNPESRINPENVHPWRSGKMIHHCAEVLASCSIYLPTTVGYFI